MDRLRELFRSGLGKFTFISSCIIVCITHVYVYTNMLLNHDSVNYYLTGEDAGYYFGCGRWMLYLVTRISGIQTLTPIICLLSIIAVASSCVLMVDLFKINHRFLIVCLEIIIVTFPSVANSFCYMYNADGIFLAYFLSVLCVWLLEEKNKYNAIVAYVLLIVTCSIYQLYWSMSVALAFMVLFLELVRGNKRMLTMWKHIGKYIVVYGCSIVSYMLINKMILSVVNVDAAGYAGLNKMMDFGSISQFISVVVNANYQVIQFYFIKGAFIGRLYLVVINYLLGVFGIWHIARRMPKRNKSNIVMMCGMLVITPTILNNISVAGKGYLHAVMMMPFVIPYLFIIACLQDEVSTMQGLRLRKMILKGTVVMLLILGYNNLLTTNKVYARQELNYEATYGYLNRLLMRIEETEEYGSNPNIKVCFINETPNERMHIKILTENPSLRQGIFDECDDMVGTNNRTIVKNVKDIYDFYDNFLGVCLSRVNEEETLNIGQTKEFLEMPSYPNQESIKVIDGVLTVKLADLQEK